MARHPSESLRRAPLILQEPIGSMIEVQFPNDDGTLEYAIASGVYVQPIEAPLFTDRVLPPPRPRGSRPLVLMALGQSNAANTGEGHHEAGSNVVVFNVFDSNYYRAMDPLPGASNDGGAVWGRVADRLLASGAATFVVLVPLAVGGTFIKDWAPGGPQNRRLSLALQRLNRAGISIDCVCWHQGEAEANLTQMTAAEYRAQFLSIAATLRAGGCSAPIHVAVATLCEGADHPFDNRRQIRLGQKSVVAPWSKLLPGPDTDKLGSAYRTDGCHFNAAGLEMHSRAWFETLTAGTWSYCRTWVRYRLEIGIGTRLGMEP